MSELKYKITGTADTSSIDKARGSVVGFRGVLEGLKSVAGPLIGITSAIALVKKGFDFARSSANEFAKAQQELAKLSVSVANNNKLNAASLQNIIKLSGDLQKKSIYGDDELQRQVSYLANLGLTENQIKRTLDTAVNMASSGITTLDTAVKGIGQSYQGITKGLGTLLPEVKNLTAEQLKAGAAADIIAQRFKGMAEMMAGTVAGTRAQFTNLWGDFKEKIGTVFAAVEQGFMRSMLPILEKVNEWLDKNMDSVLAWAIKVPKLFGILVEGLWNVIKRLFNPQTYLDMFKAVIGAIWGAVVRAFETLVDLVKAIGTSLWEPIKAGFNLAVEFIVNAFGSAINKIIQGLNWVITQINKIPGVNIGTIKELGKLDLDTKINTSAIVDAWKSVGNSYLDYLKGLGTGILDFFGASPLGALEDSFNQMRDVLKEDVSSLVNQIKNPGSTVTPGGSDTTQPIVTEAMQGNGGLLPDMSFLNGLADGFGSLFTELSSAVMSIGPVAALIAASKPIIDGVMSVLQPIVESVLQPFVNFLSIIGQTLGKIMVPLVLRLVPVLELLMKGLIFLYNWAIRPIANAIIWITVQLNNAIAWVINSIIAMLNKIPGVSIGWSMGYMDYNQMALSAISEADLGSSGGSAAGSPGASASYTGKQSITNNIWVSVETINGTNREAALQFLEEIKSAIKLGLTSY